MNHEISIINHYLDTLFFTLKKNGIKRSELLRGIYLDKEHTPIDKGKMINIWKYAVQLTKDESLGFEVGKQLQLGAYGIVGTIMLYSEDIETALNQAVRFQSLINQGCTIYLHQDSELVLEYQFANESSELIHYIVECVITGFVHFAKYALPFELTPIKVEFSHPPPKNINKYEVFFNCPVLFNAKRCSISFDRGALEYKITTANKELFHHHVNIAERILSRVQNTPWINRVRDVIFKEPNWGIITSNKVANYLGVTQRKMQRILQSENTNFKKIFDDIRKEKAYTLIAQGKFSIIEVSEILGYNDSSSFHRAYKRWYGISPKTHSGNNQNLL